LTKCHPTSFDVKKCKENRKKQRPDSIIREKPIAEKKEIPDLKI
jgi:hypothetical protein